MCEHIFLVRGECLSEESEMLVRKGNGFGEIKERTVIRCRMAEWLA